MNKIIILNGCEDCPYIEFIQDFYYCEYLKVECPHKDRTFLGDCPLKSLPQKNREPASWLVHQVKETNKDVQYWKGYANGWNSCLNEINKKEQ